MVEVNPTSNLLIGDLHDLASHPLCGLALRAPSSIAGRRSRFASARMIR